MVLSYLIFKTFSTLLNLFFFLKKISFTASLFLHYFLFWSFLCRARTLKRQGSGSSLHRPDPNKRPPPAPSSGISALPPATAKLNSGATVESLLSPQDPKKAGGGSGSVSTSGGSSAGKSIMAASRHGYRVRQCSIVEEDEEEEDDEDEDNDNEDDDEDGGGGVSRMPVKGLSRHSSTSSLADKTTTSPSLHLDLTLAFAAQRLAEDTAAAMPSMPTPAPFPPSSQIGAFFWTTITAIHKATTIPFKQRQYQSYDNTF